MDDALMYALKYPTGPFKSHQEFSEDLKQKYIENIAALPSLIEAQTQGLTVEELAYRYRPGGWTINEVVNHLVDSHMNAFIRFKLALTEDNPSIKPYEEALFVQLGDNDVRFIEDTKQLLTLLHKKWVRLLEGMAPEDFSKTYFHPASHKTFRMDTVLSLYSWHGLHHLAHIRQALDQKFE